jgi:hypothetical protein
MRIAILLLLAACATAKPSATPDPTDLNAVARADYAEARQRLLSQAGPILIVGPKQIKLIDGKDPEFLELAPPAYHQLKAISHLALGVHSLFLAQTPPPEKLAELRNAAGKAQLPEPRERQERIVKLSLQALDGSLDVATYEREVGPLLLENALDAARLEIADLDAAVARAKARLGPGFADLHVIVVGAHMAREGEIALQYFEKLFHEREGLRIVFAEGVWDEPAALQLLGTHLIDATVGQGFFNDPRRMHRDLLSDAAAQVLSGR